MEILKERGGASSTATTEGDAMTIEQVFKTATVTTSAAEGEVTEQQAATAVETQYTHASAELIEAQRMIAQNSFEKSRVRLNGEKRRTRRFDNCHVGYLLRNPGRLRFQNSCGLMHICND